MKLLSTLATASVALFAAASAQAATFNFGINYDGASQTVAAGSDPIAGTSLTPGDDFTLDLRADGNDFWQVNDPFGPNSIYAAFFVQTNGERFVDTIATFFLDGVQVAQDVQNNQRQANVHIGGQGFAFPVGLQFDQLVLAVNFLSTATTETTIQRDDLGFSFLTNNAIEYVSVSDVPLPAGALLFLTGLVAFRRKKAA